MPVIKFTKSDPPISKDAKKKLVQLYRKSLRQGMPIEELESKVKKYFTRLSVTEKIEDNQAEAREKKLKNRVPWPIRYGAIFLPVLFLSVGIYLIGSVVTPIIGYYFQADDESTEIITLISPVSKETLLANSPAHVKNFGASVVEASDIQVPTIINEQLDFTNLNNWFNVDSLPELKHSETDEAADPFYVLDIPSLNIKNAKVMVGGTDLNNSLIQYEGTANPGQSGSPVIFGHSVLRQFYNPAEGNSRRYISIFSYIMTMKPGEKIYITTSKKRYTYVVREKIEIKPEDVYILNQDFGSKTLKLITCVPEGTFLRRGVVIAELLEQG